MRDLIIIPLAAIFRALRWFFIVGIVLLIIVPLMFWGERVRMAETKTPAYREQVLENGCRHQLQPDACQKYRAFMKEK